MRKRRLSAEFSVPFAISPRLHTVHFFFYRLILELLSERVAEPHSELSTDELEESKRDFWIFFSSLLRTLIMDLVFLIAKWARIDEAMSTQALTPK